MELRNPVRASAQQPATRPATDAERAWLDVLLELEAELEQPLAQASDEADEGFSDSAADAASAPYAGSGMWRSPSQMPQLPDSLRARAEALHASQQLRELELCAERTQVQRHLEALSSVPRPRSAVASVYLDVAG